MRIPFPKAKPSGELVLQLSLAHLEQNGTFCDGIWNEIRASLLFHCSIKHLCCAVETKGELLLHLQYIHTRESISYIPAFGTTFNMNRNCMDYCSGQRSDIVLTAKVGTQDLGFPTVAHLDSHVQIHPAFLNTQALAV